MEKNQADEKALLLMAMKPLVVASGLLAGSLLPNKKKPNQSNTKPTENNVVVAIGNSDYVEEKEDESRKLLLPLLAMKPLFIASMLAGNKLPSPGIGITITKHESAAQPPIINIPSPQPVPQPTPTLPPVPPTQPPVGNCKFTFNNIYFALLLFNVFLFYQFSLSLSQRFSVPPTSVRMRLYGQYPKTLG